MSIKIKETSLSISGMTCASCVAHVEKALNELPGVEKATVNLATERATVQFANREIGTDVLIQAVRNSGYDVPSETLTLPIGGMTCASCVAHVEKGLEGVPGVTKVAVNLATERAAVTFVPGVAALTDFKKAVADTGYKVLEMELVEGEDEVDQEEWPGPYSECGLPGRLLSLLSCGCLPKCSSASSGPIRRYSIWA